MALLVLIAAALVSSAAGCAPDGGPPHSSATYKFAILPPLGWTYPSSASVTANTFDSAQSTDNVTALAKVKSDVGSAITLTLLQNSIPTSSVNYTINYNHNATDGIVSKCASGDNTFVPYKGSLYYACFSTGPAAMAVTRGSITLTSATPISENQWKTLAAKVQDNLIPRNVVFQENLVVSYGA